MAKRRNFVARLPLGPVFALLFGTAVAIVVAAAPQWRFEQLIDWTGLASVVSVARPPLGMKARLLAIALAFALVAITVWLVAAAVQRLIEGPKASPSDDFDDALDLGGFSRDVPSFDTPRRPIFADRELGAPFMSDEALTTVAPLLATTHRAGPDTSDDIPEAEIVNAAEQVPDAPGDAVLDATDQARSPEAGPASMPVTAEAQLAAPLHIAEFDLPRADDGDEPITGETSIETLIRRLEAGMARRAGAPPPPNAGPSATSSANPVSAMRELLGLNRESETSADSGSSRALDTLQRLAARRAAG